MEEQSSMRNATFEREADFLFPSLPECDIPVPGMLLLFGWYRYWYQKNLVLEKSTGTGTRKNWSRKKVPVSEKIGPGTVEFPGTPGL